MLLYTKHFNIKYLTIMGPKVYFSHCFNQSLLESFIVHILNSILGVYLPKNRFIFNIFQEDSSCRFVDSSYIYLVKISSVISRLQLAMDIQTEAKYI